ncbi:MAG: phage Gp37/Gp68 family protein [Bdellovibrionaceae bacterium]|nr:phage Gp37/Gp68 family protein [Pseudobdellovibrionaceae bacterium]
MAISSKIECTSATWNPLTGCNKVSPGCKNCYAERMSHRLQKMGQPKYRDGFKLALHEEALEIPLKWKKPKIIFVNSMSDLFHEAVPLVFIQKVFKVMHRASWHQFQILTKRAKRLELISHQLNWTSNIWMGVSVENKNYTYRIDHLLRTKARIKFLSIEPLLGPLPQLKLKGIDWVIAGGESGPKARSMKPEWALQIRDQCISNQVAFFFKQWGGVRKHETGRELEGRTWEQMPQKIKNVKQLQLF